MVKCRGQVVGDFVVDMLVDDRLLVENKAILALAKVNEVQLVNYLTTKQMRQNRLP